MAAWTNGAGRIEMPFGTLIQRIDPNRLYEQRHQLEYEFSNRRQFRRDYSVAGAYQDREWDFSDEFSTEFKTEAAIGG